MNLDSINIIFFFNSKLFYIQHAIFKTEHKSPGSTYSITNLIITSSSSCRATITDIPDPLSPLLPIIHRLWQVFRGTSRILT